MSWNGPVLAPVFANASLDDLLWMTPVSIDQVASLISDPRRWVEELNQQSTTDPVVTLRDDFALRLKLRSRPLTIFEDGKDCLVQGIVGTNILTIRPRRSIAGHVGANWNDYWRDWRDNGELKVTFDVDLNQGYGHIEVSDIGDSPSDRADKIAAFLVLGADPLSTFAGDFYLNMILGKEPSVLTKIENGVATAVTPNGPMFKLIADEDELLNIDFTLTANVNDLSSLNTASTHNPPPPPPACDNLAGTWNGTEIELDDIVVKNYP